MHLHFLGGAMTVSGSQFLLETERARLLVDCGMFQGSPNERVRNLVPFAFEPSGLDAIVLTHAHLDHCGLIPRVVADGFRGPVYSTAATAELAELVLLDSGRLQEEFARREARWERRNPAKAAAEEREERRALEAAIEVAGTNETSHVGGDDEDPEFALRTQPPELEPDLDEPLYTEADARAALMSFRAVAYGAETEVAPGIRATLLDAGHILGSAIIRLRVEGDGDRPERTIVFSGDIGPRHTPILRDPTRLSGADYVVMETTYGGREHEPAKEAVRVLAETVRLVAEHDGVLLVPSFAIGRTQEIVWELDRLIEAGEIPLIPLYLDSPMASKATEIYRRHPEAYDEETARLLRAGDEPLDYPKQIVTRDAEQSRAIAQAPRPYMIVASSGMLTGGRIVSHLREHIGDPRAVLLFVGYQGEGTLGAHLQAGARQVRIAGEVHEVRCTIRSISGFSAHADEAGLLEWLAAFANGRRPGDAGFPHRVFLVHGDPEAKAAIGPKVRALGFDAEVPTWRQRFVLD